MIYSVALSDESLIAGMASGDTRAMAALVRRYQARVYGLALREARAIVLASAYGLTAKEIV